MSEAKVCDHCGQTIVTGSPCARGVCAERRARASMELAETYRSEVISLRAANGEMSITIEQLMAENKALLSERDELRRKAQWFVERAADERLDGYRELGARAAAAENAADDMRRAMIEQADKLDRIAALYLAWVQGDEPEGAPSARRALQAIGEIVGFTDKP